ncbi:MAG TPA: response regulator [Pyrinomonadaceae bacterium]|nr:response regulator [Pyrinomonadaceae bacterium]
MPLTGGPTHVKVLIVDDIENYVRSLQRALAAEWTTCCAHSVAEAKYLLESEQIDIALVDVRLSETDPQNREGVELLKWIHTRYPDVPVIMMSAYQDFDAAVDALNLGAHQFLKKPIDLRALKEMLRSLVR